jgi:predicted HicB family RNase H-like nuclease
MLATMPETEEDRTSTQLRIETALWERAKAQAKRRRMSVNAYVCAAVERLVEHDEAELSRS